MRKKKSYTIAVDFDGTCVTHEFPQIGRNIGAIPVLRALVKNGHKIILLTMRDHNELGNSWNVDGHDTLAEALNWFAENNIPLHGINNNPDQTWSASRKVFADVYIDDMALGVPLKTNEIISPRPYVDWITVSYSLYQMGLITTEQYLSISSEAQF